MTTITDALAPENVLLDLARETPPDAVRRVAELLRNDPEVVDFATLYARLAEVAPCAAEVGCEFGICIPHARSEAVTGMVMSVGRADAGIAFPNCDKPIRYIFCIAVPEPMDADYLRIVGLLARILKDPRTEEKLSSAATPAEFVLVLSRLEAAL